MSSHVQGIFPLDQCIPFFTGVHRVEVGIRHLTAFHPVIGQQGDVAMAHESLAKDFDAVF